MDTETRRGGMFRRQAEEWAAAGRPGAPFLHVPGTEPERGSCASCGAMMESKAETRTRKALTFDANGKMSGETDESYAFYPMNVRCPRCLAAGEVALAERT